MGWCVVHRKLDLEGGEGEWSVDQAPRLEGKWNLYPPEQGIGQDKEHKKRVAFRSAGYADRTAIS